MSSSSGPCLRLEENGQVTDRWELDRRLASIGSGPACQIRIEDSSVRTLCGYVLFQMGRYRLRSLDPRAGLRLNGKLLEGEADLSPNDLVEIGSRCLRFVHGETSPEAPEREEDALEGRAPAEIRQILSESFAAVARVLRRHEPEAALAEVALSAGRILRCDGVRLIVKAPGEALWRTLASHPQGADPGRFSGSVLRMAGELGTTVHLGQLDLAGLPAAESVMLNDIRSVLCAPLELSGPDDGFLYIDRLAGHPAFEPADRALFESLRGLFGELVEAVLRADRQRREIETLQSRPASGEGASPILHESEAMQKVLREASRVAGTEVPVLVTGETGTGKELMARHIHLSGPRKDKPFVAINCGAIPENLMESELFGHEKGAFTGAHSTHEGLIESAQGGTLFLDEIGEMPLSLQVKLLRVLQQGEVVRVGGGQTIAVNFRLVCATNRNLKEEVAAGRFRSDLYFRINVIELRLPALRERGRDSILIAHQLVRNFASQYGMGEKMLGRLAEKAILEHRWPGNVRELENVVHKAVILSMGSVILPEDLGMGTRAEGLAELGLDSDIQATGSLRAVRDQAEKRCIEAALESARGNVSLTARMLDVDRKVLMRLMEKLGIQANEHRIGV